jgi:DNA-binding NarL/FixJ family response regulator
MDSNTSPKSVLIIDDHPLFRDGLEQILSSRWPEVAHRAAGSMHEVFGLLEQEGTSYDLVLLDLMLPDMDGLSALNRLKQILQAAIVCISSEDSEAVVLQCIEEGASGFIPKTSSIEIIRMALDTILSGGIYVPANVQIQGSVSLPAIKSGKRICSLADVGLSLRLGEVLRLLLLGMSNKQISQELNVASSTIKSHVSAILRNLNVTTRTQAVIAASRIGLRL